MRRAWRWVMIIVRWVMVLALPVLGLVLIGLAAYLWKMEYAGHGFLTRHSSHV